MTTPFSVRCIAPLAFVLTLVFPAPGWAADWTWTYSVRVSAAVQASPARITLSWPTDEIAATGYIVRRKAPDDRWWGASVALPASATSYTDQNVAVGGTYEYQIEKESALYSGYGYIRVAINAPVVESRGRVILVIERSIISAMSAELKRLERDLVGDGWGVVRKEVGRNDRPADVRRLIQEQWELDRANTKAVFLFGRVPVARSANLNVDGHGSRPMPTDAFYGEMDGRWTDPDGDGTFEQSGLTSDVDLEVGRVDFADLPGSYAAAAFPAEIELLKRYLDKDHNYRHARVRPPPRALMGNVGGDGRGQAYAASGYRSFSALVGAENIDEAGVDLTAPMSERWITKLTTNEYQWAYASGAGGDYSLGILGTHGQYNDLWGADFLEQRPKTTFYMFFGSWLSEWTRPDNLMRTALGAPDYGLTAVWSGRPHHFYHTMGAGETVGHGVRLTQNNNGIFYRNHIQRHLRSLHIALMGDPTLRLHYVTPPTNLQAAVNGPDVTLTWNAPSDSVLGYRVYRSPMNGAPFERVSSELHGETRFVDRPERTNEAVYMVRAVALHLGASGSYYVASQGAFSREDFGTPTVSVPALRAASVPGKVSGAATEVGSDIRHPNGNIFDQVLLQGDFATVSADPGQVLRLSYLDLNDDIVQVEFSGAGELSIALESMSGPATPAKYNQSIAYVKGHASIVITGADETTNASVFSVGRATAVNQALFRDDVTYDGVADLASISVFTASGTFGGLRTANARFSHTKAVIGVFAPDVVFTGPVYVGDIAASGAATPILGLGVGSSGGEVQITGGDLLQPNDQPVQINGITRLTMSAGTTSHGTPLAAQSIRGRLERNGVDVTTQVVVGP